MVRAYEGNNKVSEKYSKAVKAVADLLRKSGEIPDGASLQIEGAAEQYVNTTSSIFTLQALEQNPDEVKDAVKKIVQRRMERMRQRGDDVARY